MTILMRMSRQGANALNEMGAAIQKDTALSQKVSDKLESTIERPRKMGSDAMRVACLRAMVPLKDTRKLQFFYQQLNDPNPDMKVGSLNALSKLGLKESADQIANLLEHPDSHVRNAAVDAMENTATFANAEPLYLRLNPNVEPDGAIRDRVWQF